MRSVCISSGHGLKIRGASGYIDEVNEARRVVNRVGEILAGAGVKYVTFHDDTSTSQSTNLSTIVNFHNRQSRDLDVSVHFNAYSTTSKPMGVEVLYVTQQQLASNLSATLARTMALPNRGGKKRTDLYFLNNTSKPAILIEVCFVDSSADAEAYRRAFDAVCAVIAEYTGDVTIGVPVPPEPPVEPPVVEPPPEVAGVVDLVIQTDGEVAVTVNGEQFPLTDLSFSNHPVVNLFIKAKDAVVTINGQDYQIDTEEPPAPSPAPPGGIWHTGIETTMFGGSADPNNSAYPPYGYIDDKVLGCALPWRFPSGKRPKVRVRHKGREVICEILDLGPWMIDDCYWNADRRPMAEICYFARDPLPSGPNKGRVPSNAAGLDLTPAAARLIGLDGKSFCDWQFVEEEAVA